MSNRRQWCWYEPSIGPITEQGLPSGGGCAGWDGHFSWQWCSLKTKKYDNTVQTKTIIKNTLTSLPLKIYDTEWQSTSDKVFRDPTIIKQWQTTI